MINNVQNDADVMKKDSNIIVFITIMGVFISFALFLFVNSLAFEKQKINLTQVTERQLNSIQEKFDNAVKSINAVSALFAASNEVSRKEFSTFASIELIDSPNVLALEWIPKVKHSERASFESAAQKELVTNFTFTEENPQGEMVAASERDVYYPVYFSEPLNGNETALGFDLSTHPQRLRAINKARDTGVFIASGIVELVQTQQHGAGLLVVKAIYSNGLVPESLGEKRELLKGYSLGVLKLQDLFKTQTLLGDNHPQSTIFVFDNNAAVGQKILYPVMSPYQTLEEAKQAQNGLCLSKPLLLANQEWTLYQCISNNKMDYLGNIEALIVLLCSLILTFVTTRYLIVLQKQRMHSNKLLLELRNNEFYLNEIFNNVDDAIVSTDMSGRISSINHSLIKLFGYTEQELIGQSVELIVHNFTSKNQVAGFSVFSNIDQYQALGKKRVELRAKHKNSKEFPIEISIRQIKYHGRDIVIGMLKDLSMVAEREQAQLEISKNATELRQLIDTANAPIFGIDAAGLVNEWNQRAEQLTGFAKIDVMGKDLVAGFITDDYKASVKGILDKALQGEESANYEFPLFTKTGDRVDVLLNSTSRRDAYGQVIGVVGVGQDITEAKKSQAQVVQASKLATLGEMATSVAHELNQPLNVIRMAAGNSRRRIKSQKSNKDTEYILEKLVRIEGQTSRAAAIIDHMRMFGRKAEEKSEMVDPREVVSNALGLLGAQLKLAGIQVVTNFPEKCSKVMGHTIQMEQVILNLLANARDAMKDNISGSRITLSITEKDGMITISSQDTGSGIPEHILSRIFEPFFTTKEMGKGTGLGLSVSYGIILEMGGTIIAENINDGAKFSISLPATNNIIQKTDLMGI